MALHHLQHARQHAKGGPILTIKHGSEPPQLYCGADKGLGFGLGN